jgi:hypothetical protein
MGEYKDMIEMAKDEMPNTMIVVSDFPPELMNASSDIGGYNATRKQTMLRVITRQSNGNMRMYSQSLDKSDRAGLEAIYHNLGFQPEPGELLGQRMHVNTDESKQEFMVDWLMGVYDKTLSREYGGNWYAGRQSSRRVNTYDFVREQHDLINEFVRKTNQYQSIDESFMYDLAAAVKYIFEGRALNNIAGVTQSIGSEAVRQELRIAGQQAQTEGRVFSGCGATVQRSNDAPPSSEGELGDAGYGNKSEGKESWSWKKGICRVSDCPTRPGKTKVGPCDVCVSCQHLFDKGKNPAKEYTLRKAKAKYN